MFNFQHYRLTTKIICCASQKRVFLQLERLASVGCEVYSSTECDGYARNYNLSSESGSTSGTFDIASRNDFLSPLSDLSRR